MLSKEDLLSITRASGRYPGKDDETLAKDADDLFERDLNSYLLGVLSMIVTGASVGVFIRLRDVYGLALDRPAFVMPTILLVVLLTVAGVFAAVHLFLRNMEAVRNRKLHDIELERRGLPTSGERVTRQLNESA